MCIYTYYTFNQWPHHGSTERSLVLSFTHRKQFLLCCSILWSADLQAYWTENLDKLQLHVTYFTLNSYILNWIFVIHRNHRSCVIFMLTPPMYLITRSISIVREAENSHSTYHTCLINIGVQRSFLSHSEWTWQSLEIRVCVICNVDDTD